ncbi:MAG: hypothetical protein H7256_05650 [Bdellovibrio sp.]|nr:hypothetical protein [Bdellovibrio sp.]
MASDKRNSEAVLSEDSSSSTRKMIQLMLGAFGLVALFAFQNCSPDRTNEVYLMDSASHVETADTQLNIVVNDDI